MLHLNLNPSGIFRTKVESGKKLAAFDIYYLYLSYAFQTGYFILTVPKDYTNRASIVLVIIDECIEVFL